MYYKLKQGSGLNEMIAINKTPTYELGETLWNDILTVKEGKNFKLYQREGMYLTPRAEKLAIALLIKASEQHDQMKVVLPIAEYLKMTGRRDTEKNREKALPQIQEDVLRIFNSSFDTYRVRNVKREIITQMRIIG